MNWGSVTIWYFDKSWKFYDQILVERNSWVKVIVLSRLRNIMFDYLQPNMFILKFNFIYIFFLRIGGNKIIFLWYIKLIWLLRLVSILGVMIIFKLVEKILIKFKPFGESRFIPINILRVRKSNNNFNIRVIWGLREKFFRFM